MKSQFNPVNPAVILTTRNGVDIYCMIPVSVHPEDTHLFVVVSNLGAVGHFATHVFNKDSEEFIWGRYAPDYGTAVLIAMDRANEYHERYFPVSTDQS